MLKLNDTKIAEALNRKYYQKLKMLEEENETLKKEAEINEKHILDLQKENTEFDEELKMHHEECSSDEEIVDFKKIESVATMEDSSKEESEGLQKGIIRNGISEERKEEIYELYKRIVTLEEALKGKMKQLLDYINRDRGRAETGLSIEMQLYYLIDMIVLK